MQGSRCWAEECRGERSVDGATQGGANASNRASISGNADDEKQSKCQKQHGGDMSSVTGQQHGVQVSWEAAR